MTHYTRTLSFVLAMIGFVSACSATPPLRPAMLTFRVAPSKISPASDAAKYTKLLATKGPIKANHEIRRYLWKLTTQDAAGLKGLITGAYQGDSYVLLSNQIGEVLVAAKPNQPAWGITKATPGEKTVTVTLDAAAAKKMQALTKGNLGKTLVLLVDEQAVIGGVVRAATDKTLDLPVKNAPAAASMAKRLMAGMGIVPDKPTDPKAMAILKKLEAAGKTQAKLKARLDYQVQQRLTGDEEDRNGWIKFQQASGKEPVKFRIHFDTLKLGGRGKTTKQPVDYIFDGQWLTIAKHKIKTMTKIQVAADGQHVEAHRIGEGPFPVPFGQKASDVVNICEVTTRPRKAGEPKNTEYIKCVPRRRHARRVNFTRLEMWIDKATALPTKIRTRDKSKNVTTVTFRDIQPTKSFKGDPFKMSKPFGWDLTIERLGGN